ncbi:MAG: transposase, partial [Deltaproteobacteria bacterium]|nr:transposase [Deltaproteobacteria bacterium]
MARGIERRNIFKDDKDREAFLGRLAVILEETQTQCYAWALIPNHFHLLLRTGPTPLSIVMRRLMTGYAVTFNKRHKRSGHLFQNRYKSIVCEEDPYLLELIRYIHLNPIRAGLVKDLKELDKYPWCGHSSILGRRKNPLIPEVRNLKPEVRSHSTPNQPNRFTPLNCSEGAPKGIQLGPNRPEKSLAEKTIEDVLLHFGETFDVARRRYRQFVKNGIDQGTRPELQGGGLVRSAGGNKAGLLGRKKEERELGDARILGSGDFVSEALRKAGEVWEKGRKRKILLAELIRSVASQLDLKTESILSSSRRREVSKARAIVSFLAVNDLGYSATDVARALSIGRVSARQCVDRGKKILDMDHKLRAK